MTTREKEKKHLNYKGYKLTEKMPVEKMDKSRRARGGVSAKRGISAAQNTRTITTLPGKQPTVGAFPGFVFHGGPVITFPQVYISFWGPMWSSDQAYVTRSQHLTEFLQDLLQSNFMNVLSQYGVGTGAGSGVFVQHSFVTNIPTTLDESTIHSILQACINSSALPEPSSPSNNILVIFLDETIGVNDPGNGLVLCELQQDTAFGYHSFFTTEAGNLFYYAIIPALTDQCLQESCSGGDSQCSLHLTEQQEQRQTQVTSHEFAEMTSDPELNAWFDPDPQSGENGDICNGESDIIIVGANQWTVQRIYSKFDDIQTQGASYCLSQALSPEPRLSPGPIARPALLARGQQIRSYGHLLPLAPVYMDYANGSATMDTQELRDYVMNVFHPLRPEHLMADFPRMLREAATILEMEMEQQLQSKEAMERH